MQPVATVREILLGTFDAKHVIVRGWLQNKRIGGGIIFLLLRDGSGVVQCTLRKGKVDDKTFEEVESGRIESCVELRGGVKPDRRGPGGRAVQGDGGRGRRPGRGGVAIGRQV